MRNCLPGSYCASLELLTCVEDSPLGLQAAAILLGIIVRLLEYRLPFIFATVDQASLSLLSEVDLVLVKIIELFFI